MKATKTPPVARQNLRAFLQRQLEQVEDNEEPWTPESRHLAALFNEAIEGLDELDLGGFPDIFARVPLKTRGRLPAKARMLERKAVESVALLHAMGRKVGEAREIVAKSYKKTIDVIDQWRKASQNKSSPEYPYNRVRMYRIYKNKPGSPFSEERVFAQIARDGEAYKEARTKKKKVK